MVGKFIQGWVTHPIQPVECSRVFIFVFQLGLESVFVFLWRELGPQERVTSGNQEALVSAWPLSLTDFVTPSLEFHLSGAQISSSK